MKRIIICADGTWNKAEIVQEETGKPTSTNVSKVASIVSRSDAAGVEQKVLYLEGVGSTEGEAVTGGAFGWGLTRNISFAYKYLCDVFEPGDEIFLFGFSRGAYTVRSLAGLICNSGIVRDVAKIPDAVTLYREKNTPDKSKSIKSRVFRIQYSHSADIKFIGVWDTVGAMGLPLIRHSFAKALKWEWDFHTTQFDRKVINAYHALAIDERRSNFRPVLHGPPEEEHNVVEKWFRGVHSDVGGGYRETGLSNVTLKWMIDNAVQHDLSVVENWEEFLGIDQTSLTSNLLAGRFNLLNPMQFERHEEWKGFFKLMDRMFGKRDGYPREPGEGADESVVQIDRLMLKNGTIWADQYWNDTKFSVARGKKYRLTITGFNGVHDASIKVDDVAGITEPAFMQRILSSFKRSPEHKYMQVIGAIDRDHATIFAFDKPTIEIVAPRDGDLFLFMNDVPGFYWNNQGSVSFRIEYAIGSEIP